MKKAMLVMAVAAIVALFGVPALAEHDGVSNHGDDFSDIAEKIDTGSGGRTLVLDGKDPDEGDGDKTGGRKSGGKDGSRFDTGLKFSGRFGDMTRIFCALPGGDQIVEIAFGRPCEP